MRRLPRFLSAGQPGPVPGDWDRKRAASARSALCHRRQLGAHRRLDLQLSFAYRPAIAARARARGLMASCRSENLYLSAAAWGEVSQRRCAHRGGCEIHV